MTKKTESTAAAPTKKFPRVEPLSTSSLISAPKCCGLAFQADVSRASSANCSAISALCVEPETNPAPAESQRSPRQCRGFELLLPGSQPDCLKRDPLFLAVRHIRHVPGHRRTVPDLDRRIRLLARPHTLDEISVVIRIARLAFQYCSVLAIVFFRIV